MRAKEWFRFLFPGFVGPFDVVRGCLADPDSDCGGTSADRSAKKVRDMMTA